MLLRDPSTPIVLIGGPASDAELLKRTILRIGYSNVVTRAAIGQYLPQLEDETRILVIDVDALGVARSAELARSVRMRETTDYVYIIALTTSVERPLVGAPDLDVDDILTKPPSATELGSRLLDAERVIRLETEVRSKAAALETALRRLEVAAAQRALSRSRIRAARAQQPSLNLESEPPMAALRRTKAWRELDSVIGDALENFLQLSLETPEKIEEQPAFATEIALFEPDQQLEVVCGISVSDHSLRELARHIMNEADLEAGQSLLLEVANVLMGALRASFGDAGFAFTGGLPTVIAPSYASEALETAPGKRVLSFRTRDGTALGLWVQIRETRTAGVAATELREGMVVKDDVHDSEGRLLVRRGTRLTRGCADRLARSVREAVVEVFVSTVTSALAA